MGDSPQDADIRGLLRSIAREFPPELAALQLADVERIAFHVELVTSRKGTGIAICDVGGGVGLFSLGCATLGMRTTLVDDFRDEVNVRFGPAVLDLHRRYGVEIVERDAVEEGIDFLPSSLDAVTTFDSVEHWHHSPKRLFASIVSVLRPGGLFVLSAPNCVNLRKRVTVPLGSGKWSPMELWYERERFRGHVREPDVDDLRYIADDMGLRNVEIYGRNWMGLASERAAVALAAKALDRLLRLRPSLCSDLYLLGTKE